MQKKTLAALVMLTVLLSVGLGSAQWGGWNQEIPRESMPQWFVGAANWYGAHEYYFSPQFWTGWNPNTGMYGGNWQSYYPIYAGGYGGWGY